MWKVRTTITFVEKMYFWEYMAFLTVLCFAILNCWQVQKSCKNKPSFFAIKATETSCTCSKILPQHKFHVEIHLYKDKKNMPQNGRFQRQCPFKKKSLFGYFALSLESSSSLYQRTYSSPTMSSISLNCFYICKTRDFFLNMHAVIIYRYG